jgi:four helix bundle protein
MKSPFTEKSYAFSIKVVKTCDSIVESKREFILTKQLVRSGTAICALYKESQHAESRADFIHKLAIALKECNESVYWINLLFDTGKMTQEKHTDLLKDAVQLLKMLTAMILTAKKNAQKKS